ncbi:STAS/SEC14 domain-containing protein [Xanthomarina sp. F1114]|uniref:STAS/SEC14 domain-containing protein n=1 Tax=Xanthomarina sp. F1114 TaxID=2996019 RepID=UPI00225E1CE4|nr:STAS/SEC14 domain-containing protein [Xanthomarina sp. F1114]MCX7548924.1 STAS/SEC14 domain-containing protein [Xanthomarina sp. F1114]
MIEQIKTFDSNTLAFEVIDGFTETDEKLAQKLFNKKLEEGFNTVNVLVKFDEYKVTKTEFKAFFEDLVFINRKFDELGRLAYVGNSKLMEALVPVDNLFFKNKKKGREERYFDISEMEKALQFVSEEPRGKE